MDYDIEAKNQKLSSSIKTPTCKNSFVDKVSQKQIHSTFDYISSQLSNTFHAEKNSPGNNPNNDDDFFNQHPNNGNGNNHNNNSENIFNQNQWNNNNNGNQGQNGNNDNEENQKGSPNNNEEQQGQNNKNKLNNPLDNEEQKKKYLNDLSQRFQQYMNKREEFKEFIQEPEPQEKIENLESAEQSDEELEQKAEEQEIENVFAQDYSKKFSYPLSEEDKKWLVDHKIDPKNFQQYQESVMKGDFEKLNRPAQTNYYIPSEDDAPPIGPQSIPYYYEEEQRLSEILKPSTNGKHLEIADEINFGEDPVYPSELDNYRKRVQNYESRQIRGDDEFLTNGNASKMNIRRLDTNTFKPLLPIQEQIYEYKEILQQIQEDPEVQEMDQQIRQVLQIRIEELQGTIERRIKRNETEKNTELKTEIEQQNRRFMKQLEHLQKDVDLSTEEYAKKYPQLKNPGELHPDQIEAIQLYFAQTYDVQQRIIRAKTGSAKEEQIEQELDTLKENMDLLNTLFNPLKDERNKKRQLEIEKQQQEQQKYQYDSDGQRSNISQEQWQQWKQQTDEWAQLQQQQQQQERRDQEQDEKQQQLIRQELQEQLLNQIQYQKQLRQRQQQQQQNKQETDLQEQDKQNENVVNKNEVQQNKGDQDVQQPQKQQDQPIPFIPPSFPKLLPQNSTDLSKEQGTFTHPEHQDEQIKHELSQDESNKLLEETTSQSYEQNQPQQPPFPFVQINTDQQQGTSNVHQQDTDAMPTPIAPVGNGGDKNSASNSSNSGSSTSSSSGSSSHGGKQVQVAANGNKNNGNGQQQNQEVDAVIQLYYYTLWPKCEMFFSLGGRDWEAMENDKLMNGYQLFRFPFRKANLRQGTPALEFVITNDRQDWDRGEFGDNYTLPRVGNWLLQNGKIYSLPDVKHCLIIDIDRFEKDKDFKLSQIFVAGKFQKIPCIGRSGRSIDQIRREVDRLLYVQLHAMVVAAGTEVYIRQEQIEASEERLKKQREKRIKEKEIELTKEKHEVEQEQNQTKQEKLPIQIGEQQLSNNLDQDQMQNVPYESVQDDSQGQHIEAYQELQSQEIDQQQNHSGQYRAQQQYEINQEQDYNQQQNDSQGQVQNDLEHQQREKGTDSSQHKLEQQQHISLKDQGESQTQVFSEGQQNQSQDGQQLKDHQNEDAQQQQQALQQPTNQQQQEQQYQLELQQQEQEQQNQQEQQPENQQQYQQQQQYQYQQPKQEQQQEQQQQQEQEQQPMDQQQNEAQLQQQSQQYQEQQQQEEQQPQEQQQLNQQQIDEEKQKEYDRLYRWYHPKPQTFRNFLELVDEISWIDWDHEPKYIKLKDYEDHLSSDEKWQRDLVTQVCDQLVAEYGNDQAFYRAEEEQRRFKVTLMCTNNCLESAKSYIHDKIREKGADVQISILRGDNYSFVDIIPTKASTMTGVRFAKKYFKGVKEDLFTYI